MRLVGEAVADEFHTCNLTVLGIATWGKIAFRDQMVKKSSRNITSCMNLDDINKEAQQVRVNGTIYKKVCLIFYFIRPVVEQNVTLNTSNWYTTVSCTIKKNKYLIFSSFFYSIDLQIIFNDKKKRMKKLLLKNLELENRLMFQVDD